MISYRTKVRKRKFLWGGEGISPAPSQALPLFLHFRVDEEGEKIRFGKLTRDGSGTAQFTEIGILNPGECFTLSLGGLLGVYALLDDPADSPVDCYLIYPAN